MCLFIFLRLQRHVKCGVHIDLNHGDKIFSCVNCKENFRLDKLLSVIFLSNSQDSIGLITYILRFLKDLITKNSIINSNEVLKKASKESL